MLSCDCTFEPGDSDEWYHNAEHFQIFVGLGRTGKRRARCYSCKELIELYSQCSEFTRFRVPSSDIEERIYGEEVQLASYFMCEKCSEIFFNLTELGFCMNIYDGSMQTALAEYHKLTGFKK